METKVCRPESLRPDATTVDRAADQTAASRHVVEALRSIPDWSVTAAVLRATYDADVTQDGVWSALADLAGLDAEDLVLRWE